jgi:hypothetical protein
LRAPQVVSRHSQLAHQRFRRLPTPTRPWRGPLHLREVG